MQGDTFGTPAAARGAFPVRGAAQDAALALLLRRLDEDTQDAAVHAALGQQLDRMGLRLAAGRAYEAALRRDPGRADAHNNLACLHVEEKQYTRALAHAMRAVQAAPGEAAGHYNLGLALLGLGRSGEAARVLDEATRLQPGLTLAWVNAARAWQDVDDLPRARRACDEALRLDPGLDFVSGQRIAIGMDLADWRQLASFQATLPERVLRGENVVFPFDALTLVDDPALQLQVARAFGSALCAAKAASQSLPTISSGRRLRIAYLSADLRSHPVGVLMAGVFSAHDRERFEIYGVSTRAAPGDVMQRDISARFDHFEDMQGRPGEEIARWCRHQGIDILVDLGGFTVNNRPDVLACRAAPVQVNHLGYPGTMGMPCVDYIVADRHVIPPLHRAHYSECVLYLPQGFQSHDDSRERPPAAGTRGDWGLPEHATVFCCFNRTGKITPEVWECWARILERVPGSVLWLTCRHEEVVTNLMRALQTRGLDPSRLRFARRQGYRAYMGMYAHADLFLDTWPFNTGTTACDALWMGLPVLTLCGRTFAARMATSLLRELGLDELVCDDAVAYVNMAVALAHDPLRLGELKALLAMRREASTMNDTRRWTRQFEAGLEAMAERSRRGWPPADIVVQALSAPGGGGAA